MNTISKLIDDYVKHYSSDENKRRLELWDRIDEGIRGEVQWHGIPKYSVSDGHKMPVTVECLDKIWEELLGLDLQRYFTDPMYYLEYYLKIKIKKFLEFRDDTPLTMEIPVAFGTTHEAGMLGQEVIFPKGGEPCFGHASIVDENTIFPETFDFNNNPYLNHIVLPFYNKVKELAGSQFKIIFPQWFRGPQGVSLYIRGFQEFSMDLYLNEDFSKRLLRYVTDAAKAYNIWREEYTGDPIRRGDLFNDDIPIMSPDMYTQFFLPYEQELSDFYGGVYYWHSCGDITQHVSAVHQLTDIDVFDFGVTMENKTEGIAALGRKQLLELRVMAQTHIQDCSEEHSKAYVREIMKSCKEKQLDQYVLRSSGMSVLKGAAEDIKKLSKWIDMVREVQSENN